MKVFVIINNVGIMISVDANVKNWLINVYAIKDTWNPSNCDCECDKSCDLSEYLDYKNSKCKGW